MWLVVYKPMPEKCMSTGGRELVREEFKADPDELAALAGRRCPEGTIYAN
jgi:hypothetical protein